MRLDRPQVLSSTEPPPQGSGSTVGSSRKPVAAGCISTVWRASTTLQQALRAKPGMHLMRTESSIVYCCCCEGRVMCRKCPTAFTHRFGRFSVFAGVSCAAAGAAASLASAACSAETSGSVGDSAACVFSDDSCRSSSSTGVIFAASAGSLCSGARRFTR